MTLVTLKANGSAQLRADQPGANYSGQASYDLSKGPLLVTFAAPAVTYRYRKILGIEVGFTEQPQTQAGTDTAWVALDTLRSGFTPSTVTANSAPERDEAYNPGHAPYGAHPILEGRVAIKLDSIPSTGSSSYKILYPGSPAAPSILRNGLALRLWPNAGRSAPAPPIAGTGGSSTYYPEIEVNFDSSNIVCRFGSMYPAEGGYADKAQINRFSWSFTSDDACYDFPGQSYAKFRWRVGSSGTVHEVNIGTDQYYDVPANTFTAADIQWQVQAYLSNAQSLISDWIAISTADAIPTTVCVSPVSTVVNGDEPVTLVWDHIISTGTPSLLTELAYSADGGTTWTALHQVDGPELSWVVPAGTFPAGEIVWRARSYNQDQIEGGWSTPAVCYVITAPGAPSVSATQTPRPLISWQAQDQQAYEVRVDGESSGPRYGTGKTYKWPRYLADGTHTVEVRVQNAYSMWSPRGSGALTSYNTPGADITLTATGGREATLSWTDVSADAYIVYRDGLAIAKVTDPSYTDYLSIGAVEYQVRAISNSSDDYTLSNRVTVEVSTDCLLIADAERPIWLALPLTAEEDAPKSVYSARTATLRHYVGQAYPSVEWAEYKTRTLSFTAAFTADAGDQQRALEALVGRVVCVKTKAGELLIGALTAISYQLTHFMTAYDCTVEQVEWPEEVEL